MHLSWRLSLVITAILCFHAATLSALTRPTPEQMRQYQADGTWADQVAKAYEIGNNRLDPALAARLRARLQREAATATGQPAAMEQAAAMGQVATEAAPPPVDQGGLPAKGTVKTLVLLIDFSDYPHSDNQTTTDVAAKFFADGDASQYPYESLRNFYQRSSYNQLTIQGNVLGWYRAANSRDYYMNHTTKVLFTTYHDGEEILIMEALNYYNSQGHDFTQYDNDGNGSIDAVYAKWTGPDNGWSNFWWAKQKKWHSSFWEPNYNYRIDGKSMGKFVWSWISSPENQPYQPRVDIHETGHLLGLPDYYDYDDTVGPKGGVGGLDMMDGNWGDHNCFSKYILEWLSPTVIVNGSQVRTLQPSGTSKDCVLIMPGFTAGQYYDEFFMAQYRKRSIGNDPADYPADGLTIWHVDSTLSVSDWAYDNSETAHKILRLMEADGLEQIEANQGANAGDFYLPPKWFGPTTAPNSTDYTGAATGIVVDQLTAPGTTMDARFTIATGSMIVTSGSALTAESCGAGNTAIDPGEIVTVTLSLQNIGVSATSNLVATLLPSGGVTNPSGAQSYGGLAPGAAPVARPFTFQATGDCGSTLTATLQLQDGANSLGSVAFTFTLGVKGKDGTYSCCFTSISIGDFDGDGDVDQDDFGRFQVCLDAAGKTAPASCLLGRLDNDSDVDRDDLVLFRKCLSGPGVAPSPDCKTR